MDRSSPTMGWLALSWALALALSACAHEPPPRDECSVGHCPELHTCLAALCALSGGEGCLAPRPPAVAGPAVEVRPMPYAAAPLALPHDEPPPRVTAIEVRPLETEADTAPGEGGQMLRIWPNHVIASVDGQLVNAIERLHLAPGTHVVTVDDTCCEPYRGVLVVPDEPTDKVMVHALTLTLRPAALRLVNAPADAVAVCRGALVLPGAETTIALESLGDELDCVFHPGGRRMNVSVAAGSITLIPW
jgi:hypothetical protein